MVQNWDEIESKLQELFIDDEIRGKCRGALLNRSSEDRLKYFRGSNTEIKAALGMLFSSETGKVNKASLTQAIVSFCLQKFA